MSDQTGKNTLFMILVVGIAGAGSFLFFDWRSPEDVVAPSPVVSPHTTRTAIPESPPVASAGENLEPGFEDLPIGDPRRLEQLDALASLKANGDPRDALTWADGLSVPAERIRALSTIISSRAFGDPVAMAEAIESLEINVSLIGIGSSHSPVSILTGKLLEVWPPEKAFDWIDRNLTGDARRTNTGNLISQLARKNPEAAAQRIESMPNGPARKAAITTLVSGWAYKNGSEALHYVEALELDQDRNEALDRLAFSWVYADKNAVIEQVESLSPGDTRDALLGSLAAHVAQETPNAALNYADQIQGDARIDATRNLVRRWTEVDPTAAGEHVAQIENPKERVRLAGVLLKAWLESEPGAAAAWAANYGGEGGATVTKEFMAQWIHRDPNAASTWLGKLDEGPSRDAGIEILILHESSNDPDAALRWAETISDPDMRHRQTGWLKKEISRKQ